MRKLMTSCTIIVLTLMLYDPFVFAGINDYAVSIDNVSGVPGAAVTAHVRLTQAGSDICGGAEFNILFDPDALQVDSVQAGSLRSWGMFQHVILNGNTVRILMVGTEETLNTIGEIALINFSIKSSASLGTSNLTFTKAVLNLNSTDLDFPPANITNGTVTVIKEIIPPIITGWLPVENEIRININEGAAIQFALTNIQDDGPAGELTFAWEIDDNPVPGQTGQTFDAALTVANLPVGGDYTVKVTVTDIDGLSANHTWILKIRASPVVSDIQDQTIDEGAAFNSINLDNFVNDLDTPDDQIAWDVNGNANLIVTIDGNRVAAITTPIASWTGSETLIFTATDPDGYSASDTAAFTVVQGINDPPVANTDTVQTDEDTPINITVLANDNDPDAGDTINLTRIVNQPLHGTAVIQGNIVRYTPCQNYNGQDTLVYEISDLGGLTATATVTITVNPVNDAPLAVDDTAVVDAGRSVVINVLANDSDVDGDSLVVDHIGVQPAKGGVTIAQDAKSVTYTADAGFTGADTFDYTIADGNGGFATATVTVSEKLAASPWAIDADPNQLFFYPIYGTAKRGLQHLQEGDWIGVFDAKGICYGAGQYHVNPLAAEGHEYALSVYAVSGGSSFGTQDNNKMYFKFYIVSTKEELAAVDSGLVPRYYPNVPEDGGYQGDPVRIDLSAAVEQGMVLKRGWNLISFTVQPESTRLEEVFNSILTGDNNYLEYVADHKDFWDRGIQGGGVRGSLTDVDAYHSYYLKISGDCPPEGVTLTIVGVRAQPNHEFKLVRGWNNISYLLDISKYAILEGPTAQNPQPTYALTGVFKDIKDNIIWLKGATDENGNNWCAPLVSYLKLGPGRGLFLKMHETLPDDPDAAGAISFRYNEQ